MLRPLRYSITVDTPIAVATAAIAMAARLREWGNDVSGSITTAGASTAYTIASNQGFDTLAHLNGQMIAFVPHVTCGNPVTLNVDGTGAKPLRASPGVELPSGFLTTFGRPTRETVCSCEVRLEPTLSQSLHLLNGDTVATKVSQGNSIGKMLAEKKPPAFIIENLYVRCLSRPPTEVEMRKLVAAVEANPNKQQALEDVFWAILNSREFMFNH